MTMTLANAIDEKRRRDPQFDDAFEYESIVTALTALRQSKNMSQEQLSKKTGLTQGNISRTENGKLDPSVTTLQRLARGLGMKLKIELVNT